MQGFNDYIARTNLYESIGGEHCPSNFVAVWTNTQGITAGVAIAFLDLIEGDFEN